MQFPRSFVLTFLALASAAHAGILFDNMGPTDTFYNNATRPTYQNRAELASRFTISQTSVMTGFEAVLEAIAAVPCCNALSNPRSFTVTVYDGNSGVGAALGSTTVSQVLPVFAGPGWPVSTVSFSTGLLLAPGAYYVGINNPGVDIGWYMSVIPSDFAYAGLSVDTGLWGVVNNDRYYTTRILGDPVPEPATFILFASALAFAASPRIVRAALRR